MDLEPISCVCTQLKMASRAVGRAYDAALAATGVNVVQYSILVNVRRHQPLGQMALAEHLDMERTTLYRALDLLEKRGWIATRIAGEGVAKEVRLTADGTRVCAAAERAWREVHDGVVDDVGAQKLKKLAALLAEVREHFRS